MYLGSRLDKGPLRATITALLNVTGLIRTALFAWQGDFLRSDLLVFIIPTMLAVVLGILVGRPIADGMPKQRFAFWLRMLVVGIGLFLIVRAVSKLASAA